MLTIVWSKWKDQISFDFLSPEQGWLHLASQDGRQDLSFLRTVTDGGFVLYGWKMFWVQWTMELHLHRNHP